MTMIENQSSSKKERTDYQSGCDMLSELPSDIIHSILALVPIRDAIKTSILSRRWRYTWASLPHLVFKRDLAIQDYKSRDEFEDCMESFITHVLVLHKGPIHKFKLSVPFTRICNIGVWLLCLFKNDIRELIIDMDHHDSNGSTQELHSSIYSLKKLTKLELYNCALDPPPTRFKAFLFLRCLCLRRVFLSTNEVESLVANCPLLEEFTLIYCGSSVLRFSAPNLKVLRLLDDYIEMSVYAPLLAELLIQWEDHGIRFNRRQHDNSVCNYTNIMGGFNNIEKLQGHLYFTMHLSMGIESCHHPLVFPRLKDIELDQVNLEDIRAVSVVVRLIVGAPNLETIKIENILDIDKDDDASEEEVPHVSFSDLGCTPNFKFEKLRVVRMRYVTSLTFISLLLERSPVLETMSFTGLYLEEQQNLSAELEGCNWASPNVKLAMIDD